MSTRHSACTRRSVIRRSAFPKPIKLGRSSRWYKSEVEQWK
ncbi:TPA: helix-turn-helix transcriptional regulator [Escherichia coli]